MRDGLSLCIQHEGMFSLLQQKPCRAVFMARPYARRRLGGVGGSLHVGQRRTLVVVKNLHAFPR